MSGALAADVYKPKVSDCTFIKTNPEMTKSTFNICDSQMKSCTTSRGP